CLRLGISNFNCKHTRPRPGGFIGPIKQKRKGYGIFVGWLKAGSFGWSSRRWYTGGMSIVFKRTKILATVGPAVDSEATIKKLIASGVNGFRLNFSHGSHEERDR